MAAHVALTPQRTLDLTTPLPPKRKRGATGGKWSWSDDEIARMLKTSGEFDRCLIGPGLAWGFRISELLSLRVSDVLTETGELRAVVTVPSNRLKGGKPPKASAASKAKPVDHVDGCQCKLCTPKPKTRRKPDDRSVPMGAAAMV